LLVIMTLKRSYIYNLKTFNTQSDKMTYDYKYIQCNMTYRTHNN